ncbi:MAG: hypothetical protein J1G06_07045 [Oscillospiraceae bacterium]|nr:hypothetical protein [Oscillospiraceae bacterium]
MYIGKWKITTKDLKWFIVCLILIICFLVGLSVYNQNIASAVLSGASTSISIVLSIVAILYTMIEGANSSKVNQESINKLANIDNQLNNLVNKTLEWRELDKKLKVIVDTAIETVDNSSSNGIVIDKDIKDQIEALRKYINEDIDE